ncbi:hypothetical protein EES42_05875 [Streptomyces sp. ADI95-17]|nr:hypothetical protein EES42_05875 [Streptomyces sp. ADI95-17]
MWGSSGHSTRKLTSVTAKVSTPQGSRTKEYSTARQPTGSLRLDQSQAKNPLSRRDSSIGLGSSTGTPSIARARPRSALPISRAPCSPTASSGRPITVTASATPTPIMNTV